MVSAQAREHCEASKPNPASSKSSKGQPESYVSSEDDSMPSPERLVEWAAKYSEDDLLHEKSSSKRKFKHHKQSHTQDVEESSSSDEEPIVMRRKRGRPLKARFVKPSQEQPQKRPRGRPRKPIENKARHSTQKHFSIAVYVEIAVPPKFRLGKTPRGNKVEKQEPRTEGPFTLTRRTTWDEFLEDVSATARVERENLTLDGMTWGLLKKGKLPLSNEVGYHAMIQQIKTQKDPGALIVVVALPLPKMPQLKRRMEEDTVEHQVDDTLWGQKVCSHIVPDREL
jgi:hypothetical protein